MKKNNQSTILNLKDVVSEEEYRELITLAHLNKYKKRMLFNLKWIERRCLECWQDKQPDNWGRFFVKLWTICDDYKEYKLLRL